MEILSQWLDRASIGESSVADGELDIAQSAKIIALANQKCAEWAARWCSVDVGRIVLTTGTTDACDAALLVRNEIPEVIVYTDLAHNCTRGSVIGASRFLSTISNTNVTTATLAISDLFSLPPKRFVNEMYRRLSGLIDGRKAILVLEHVTSVEGFRLPLDHIVDRSTSLLPQVDLVIDGSQAVGLWRPPASLTGAYVGCFHKYLDGPVATGFAVLPSGLAEMAPYRLSITRVPLQDCPEEHFPTTDIGKWTLCSKSLEEFEKGRSTSERITVIENFRELLVQELPEQLLDRANHVLPIYKSHILLLKSEPLIDIVTVWQFLRNRGFSTKRTTEGIRITLHDGLRIEMIESFSSILAQAVHTQVKTA